jgi:D-alanine-D-alanine ligase
VGLSPELQATVANTALSAFRAVGLRDYARMDIRLSADGVPFVIDVNPNCDLSDLAGGYSRAAKAAGLSYKDMIMRIAQLALSRASDLVALGRVGATANPDKEADTAATARPKGRAPGAG